MVPYVLYLKFYVTNIYLQSKMFTEFNFGCRLIIFMKIKTTFCYFLTLYIGSNRCFDPKLDFNLIGCLTVRMGHRIICVSLKQKDPLGWLGWYKNIGPASPTQPPLPFEMKHVHFFNTQFTHPIFNSNLTSSAAFL